MATAWVPTGRSERPHPLTPLVRGWVIFAALLFPLIQELGSFRGDENGEGTSVPWWVLGAGLLATALIGGIASFVTWRFTRFVIDDREVRIETGWLNKSSRKVPFERVQSIDVVQPFVGRLFGLAELEIQAGGSDSQLRLRYLSRQRANQLRDHLLTRAMGESSDALTRRTKENVLTGISASDDVLIRLTPTALIVGFLTSGEFIWTAAVLVVSLIGLGIGAWMSSLGVLLAGLPLLLPLVVAIGNLASKYVLRQVNYTMVRTGHGSGATPAMRHGRGGVRITAGLTSLTSRTIPFDRVQGLKIHQSLLWRPLGLFRIDVDVIGTRNEEADTDSHGNVLLPIGTAAQVATILDVILPDTDLTPDLRPAPRRCRWLRPFDFWTLKHGVSPDVVVTEQGWLHHVRLIVPHAKTQSVRIRRGPLQRALGLASVFVDNVDGPVNVAIKHQDPQWARELALSQLDRARTARNHAPR